MKRPLLVAGPLLALLFSSAALQCQQLAVETGSGKHVLSRADLEELPHVKVTASEHSSVPVSFEGVTLKSVLEKAGVTFGESMKGKRLATVCSWRLQMVIRWSLPCRNWTRRSQTSRPRWFSCGMGNRSVRKKGHTEL